jgi:coproporphyrinogen III oxidase-like Fe-S oxidoreductase
VRRFTFDLIYGRPGQSEVQWRAELARALDLVGDHVPLYQLTIEPAPPRHWSDWPRG